MFHQSYRADWRRFGKYGGLISTYLPVPRYSVGAAVGAGIVDIQRNPAGGGFGRRGAHPMQAATHASALAPRQSGVGRHDSPSVERPSALKVTALFFATLVGLICLEAMLSGTTLITPVSPLLLEITSALGFVLGFALAVLVAFNPERPLGMGRKALVLLVLPFLTAFAGDQAGWRIADRLEFTFSSAAFTPASYPVTFASRGRKGRYDSVEIDPFGLKDSTNIAIPREQYEAIWRDASDYCVTVMQRRSAAGAIEIINDGVFNLNAPAPATLTPCPEARLARELRNARAVSSR